MPGWKPGDLPVDQMSHSPGGENRTPAAWSQTKRATITLRPKRRQIQRSLDSVPSSTHIHYSVLKWYQARKVSGSRRQHRCSAGDQRIELCETRFGGSSAPRTSPITRRNPLDLVRSSGLPAAMVLSVSDPVDLGLEALSAKIPRQIGVRDGWRLAAGDLVARGHDDSVASLSTRRQQVIWAWSPRGAP